MASSYVRAVERARGSRRGSSGRGRGGTRAAKAPQKHLPRQRDRFEAWRVNTTEDGTASDSNSLEERDTANDAPEDESDSDGEDEATAANAYAVLLQTLNGREGYRAPSPKRQKLNNDQTPAILDATLNSTTDEQESHRETGALEHAVNHALEAQEKESTIEESDEDHELDSEDETTATDPFQQHFSSVDEELLAAGIASVAAKTITTTTKTVLADISIAVSNDASWPAHDRDIGDISMKRRLQASGVNLAHKLVKPERHMASSLLCYRDVVWSARSLANAGKHRDLAALHALNHVFKTRDRIIKNNSKLAQQADNDTLDLRDQGFTRPKVLVILPTRKACVRFVESIVRLSHPEQQENKSRFMASFADQADKTWEDKPEDFQDLFGGNDDDMFRLGLKFTRKTIKYFSAFYSSDIVLASPLGLMRAIGDTSGKDEQKKHDADFLSSIEIVIVDHANALLMQNWQHVEYIFSQLNLLPKEPHGCDFSRVRNWYLDGHAKYLRQTIILTDYLSPDINSVVSKYLHNIAGTAKYKPAYPGALLKLPPTLPYGIRQTFNRFTSPDPSADSDARFMQFCSTILPSLLQSHSYRAPTLIYIPTYADFVRIRNHFSTSQTTASLSFGTISEYTSVRDVARARSHFLSGRHSVLLYTERAHHFRRYKIRGVRRVIFYGVPENPLFWSEIVGFLGLSEVDDQVAKAAVRAMFSKWDVLKLERIVGTERIGRLISDTSGDTFEFT